MAHILFCQIWYVLRSPLRPLARPSFLMPLYHALKILSATNRWLKGRFFFYQSYIYIYIYILCETSMYVRTSDLYIYICVLDVWVSIKINIWIQYNNMYCIHIIFSWYTTYTCLCTYLCIYDVIIKPMRIHTHALKTIKHPIQSHTPKVWFSKSIWLMSELTHIIAWTPTKQVKQPPQRFAECFPAGEAQQHVYSKNSQGLGLQKPSNQKHGSLAKSESRKWDTNIILKKNRIPWKWYIYAY